MEVCKCTKESDIAKLTEIVERNQADIKILNDRSEVMYKLSEEITKLTIQVSYMNGTINEVKADVKELKSEKGKWYDKIKWLVASMLIGSAVTMVITQITTK